VRVQKREGEREKERERKPERKRKRERERERERERKRMNEPAGSQGLSVCTTLGTTGGGAMATYDDAAGGANIVAAVYMYTYISICI